jgi:hypothetical protein
MLILLWLLGISGFFGLNLETADVKLQIVAEYQPAGGRR